MKLMNKSFLQKNLRYLLSPISYLLLLATMLLTACGYKPSSHVIQNVFDESVYVEVLVDSVEPENAPFIKDEMNRIVYTRFKGKITSKAKAQSHIRIAYAGSTFTPLAYEDGYVTRYRANVRARFDMLTKEGKIKKDILAVQEAEIQASSLVSSTLRTEAIRKGLKKALDEFLAYVSAKGMVDASASK